MPTYKEVLKKLRTKKTKPRKKPKPKSKLKPRLKPRLKPKPTRQKSRRVGTIRRVRKPAKKVVRKPIRKKPVSKKSVKKTRRKAAKRPIRRVRQHAKLVAGKKKKRKKPTKPRVYIGKGILDQLFESQAKVKLLKFFFRNAENMFQPKDIFKQLRTNAVLLRQEMKKLENTGLIKQKKTWLTFKKKRGGIKKEKKMVWYLNPGFEFIKELGNLVLKSTIASKDDLIIKTRKLGNIKLLVLSGILVGNSTARVDLLIVGDKINHRKLNNFIKDIEAEIGKELRCAVMTNKEFNYRYDMYDRFVRDLLTDNCEILIKKVNLW